MKRKLLSMLLALCLTLTLLPCTALADNTANEVAQVGDTKYDTLAEAVTNAEEGGVVTLLKSVEGTGIVIDKDITIDFSGYTYTFTTPAVGSKGTTTNGFQILKDNTVTLKNGRLGVAAANKTEYTMLIQNYANLTVTDMILDGTNLDRHTIKDYNYSYVMSNNSGTVKLNGSTSIIGNDSGDGYAFDVYQDANYAVPNVTVDTTGTISGSIETTYIGDATLSIKKGTFSDVNAVKYLTADADVTVKLAEDVTVDTLVIKNGKVGINLGGKKLTCNAKRGIEIYDADVTITNGTVVAGNESGQAINVYAGGTDEAYNSLNLVRGAVVDGSYAVIVRQYYNDGSSTNLGYGSTVNVENGAVLKGNIWVMGNITNKGDDDIKNPVTINVNGGSVTSTTTSALQGAGYAVTNIKGGTLTGLTGVEMRAGKLNVTGGTIIATSTPASGESSASGSTTKGVGIALSQHTTNLPINVSVSAGNVKGYKAVEVNDYEDAQGADDVKLTVSGGYFSDDTVKAYLAAGKVLATSDKAGYAYMVADKSENIDVNTDVAAAEPNVEAAANSGVTAAQVEAIANAVKDNETTNANLQSAAANIANDATVVGTADEAADALEKAGVTVDDGDTVTVVVQPYLDITVNKFDSSKKTLSLDIKAKYNVVATTATGSEEITDENSAVLKENQTMAVTTPVTITVALPDGFVASNDDVIYVHHTKDDGTTYVYKATVTRTGEEGSYKYFATFVNPNGFSNFVLKTTAAASITVGGETTYYASLADAVAAVKDNETVVLLADNSENVTVERSVKFKLDISTCTFSGSIAAGKDTTVTKTTSGTVTTYTFVYAEPEEHTVTIAETENGEVSVDKAAAYAGDTVVIYAEPDDGYVVDTVKVTYKDGDTTKEVTVSGTGVLRYFTMPEADVMVTVTFKEGEVVLPFTDVLSDKWYYEYVEYVYKNKLMDGMTSTTFEPKTTTTRAMLVTVIYRLEGEPTVTAKNGFTDVPAGKYFTDAVTWAAANGIVKGDGNGTFRPLDEITREEFVTILYRYAAMKGYDVAGAASLAGYPDADEISTWAVDAFKWAVAEGYVSGRDTGELDPSGYLQRAELAKILTLFDIAH